MKELTLNDGNIIPIIGFGTYLATEQEGIETLQNALKNGYCLIDTAAMYHNEVSVGKAIKSSGINREDIFITTKLWRDNLSYKHTKTAFNTSLEKLGLDYIDLYLIHWPANTKNYNDWKSANANAWRAMEELQSEGKIKSIGVSNFWQEHLDALMQTANVMPAINQIEFHPGYWQPEVTNYCKKLGIEVESWSPLARGRVFENAVLKNLAKKYGKSVSQICLRWVIQHDVVVIPKSTTPERIKENINIFDFVISDGDMAKINELPEMGFSGELPNL